jgi:hypothetical protein
LYDDNEILSFGYVQINGISNNKVSLTFFGNNADWYSQIKDFKLTDIDLSDIDHAWSEANIVGSWSNNWDDGYIYPAVDYGLMQSLAITEVYHWFPAVFLRYLLRAGFEQKGFKIGGSLLNEDFFNKVIIPFSKQDFVNGANLIENEGTAYKSNQTISTSSETKIDWASKNDNNGGWDVATNDRFTAGADGVYEAEFTVFNISTALIVSNSLEIRIKINGTDEETINVPNYSGAAHTFKRSYNLSNTDYIEWYVYHTRGGNEILSFVSSVQYQNKVYPDSTIIMQYTLPDMEFSELLKWVSFTFGVVYTYNSYSKTIEFNLFKDIPFNTPLDWTEKLIEITNYDYSTPTGS